MNWDEMRKEIPFHYRPRKVFERADGTFHALALGYVSRQDVQDRLDEVAGPGNWEVAFHVVEPHSPIVKCTLTIRDPESDMVYTYEEMGGPQEGQSDPGDRHKAACSDAFKRAATHPGIGRFLYRLEAGYKECHAYRTSGGKLVFKGWVDAAGPSTAGDHEEMSDGSSESGGSGPAPSVAAPSVPTPAPAGAHGPMGGVVGATTLYKPIPAGGTDSSQYPDGPYPCRYCGDTNTYVKDTSGRGATPAHTAVWCRNTSCEAVKEKYSYSYPYKEKDKHIAASAVVEATAEEPDDLPF